MPRWPKRVVEKIPGDWSDKLRPEVGPFAPPPTISTEPAEVPRHWGYCRQSPHERWDQKGQETDSLKSQADVLRREIGQEIEQHGGILGGIVMDPWQSATETRFIDRRMVQQLLCKLQPGDVFWVCDLDRLGRSQRDVYNALYLLADAGIRIRATNFFGRELDMNDMTAKIWLSNMSLFAEIECMQKRRRQLRANKWRRDNGLPIGCSRKLGERRVFVKIGDGSNGKPRYKITDRVIDQDELNRFYHYWCLWKKKHLTLLHIWKSERPRTCEDKPLSFSMFKAWMCWCHRKIQAGMNPFTFPPTPLREAPEPPSNGDETKGDDDASLRT